MPNISNWTEGLSLFWGIALISSALMILTQPNLRQTALTIFQNNKNRLVLVGICLFIAIFHLYVYKEIYGGTDYLLLAIGYITGVKGLILLIFPSVLKTSEKILVSNYMSGWILIMLAIGLYLINQALHLVTL